MFGEYILKERTGNQHYLPGRWIVNEVVRDRNKDTLDSLAQQVYDSECPLETKNLFINVVNSMHVLNESIEAAHGRLDKRKTEYEKILKEFKKVSEQVVKLTDSQVEQNKICMTLIESVRKEVEALNRAFRRQNLFTAIVIALTLISMFGAVKGATTASSIWNIVKVLIPS